MASFNSTTGYGLETVQVSYEYDDDTNTVYGVEVKWNGIEVSGLLSEEVNSEIEMECFANERKELAREIAEFNYDCGEKLAQDMHDALEAMEAA